MHDHDERLDSPADPSADEALTGQNGLDQEIGTTAPAVKSDDHDELEATGANDGPGTSSIDGLIEAVERIAQSLSGIENSVTAFNERAAAQEALVVRMQERIEVLQGDQVRALLSPVYQELASLHADLSEAAVKNYAALPPERLPKELSFLVTRVDSALQLLGLESVGAAPGVEFDSRLHSAARRVPTGREALDRTIETVQRQGFIFPGAAKASMYARVTVYRYDAALAAAESRTDLPDPGDEPVAPAEAATAESPAGPSDLGPREKPAPERVPNVPRPPMPAGYTES